MFDDEESVRGRDEHGECREEIHRLRARVEELENALQHKVRSSDNFAVHQEAAERLQEIRDGGCDDGGRGGE